MGLNSYPTSTSLYSTKHPHERHQPCLVNSSISYQIPNQTILTCTTTFTFNTRFRFFYRCSSYWMRPASLESRNHLQSYHSLIASGLLASKITRFFPSRKVSLRPTIRDQSSLPFRVRLQIVYEYIFTMVPL